AAWNRGSKRARSTATPSSLKSRYTRSFQASPSASSVPPKSNSTAVFEVVSIPRAYACVSWVEAVATNANRHPASDTRPPFLYQQVAEKAMELRCLEISSRAARPTGRARRPHVAQSPNVVGLECPRCRTLFKGARLFTGCPRCDAQKIPVNLSVKLELGPLARLKTERFPATPRGLWRFRALLPVASEHPVTLGEGDTPLIHLERIGRRLGPGHDEDADAGVRRRRRRLPDAGGALGPHAPGDRALRMVPDRRVPGAADRVESVRDRGLQDPRV